MAALTDTKLRSLKPRPAVYRVADMLGLCIEVRPTGFKAWRFRYRFGGKGRMLNLGTYPQMSLQDARKERDKQRELVAKGNDPSDVRRQDKAFALVSADDSFEAIAREWMRTRGSGSRQPAIRRSGFSRLTRSPGSASDPLGRSLRRKCSYSYAGPKAWGNSRPPSA